MNDRLSVTDERPANPATGLVVVALDRQTRILKEIRNAAVRRESPAPGVFHFWPGGFRVQPQLRVSQLCVAPIAAFQAGVQIGSNVAFRFALPADGVLTIPAEIVVNRGETIRLIDLATGADATTAQLLDAWLFAFVDAPPRQDEQ